MSEARPALTAVPAPSADAQKKNKRLVLLALEDCFDERVMRYRPGNDDASVAKELDLSPAFISSVREEFYGKLAEPEGISDLRMELEGLRAAVAAAERKFETLCRKHGWD